MWNFLGSGYAAWQKQLKERDELCVSYRNRVRTRSLSQQWAKRKENKRKEERKMVDKEGATDRPKEGAGKEVEPDAFRVRPGLLVLYLLLVL